jgi:polyphosphate kinase 2 (PPK2 family)
MSTRIDTQRFQVEGGKVDLGKRPTRVEPIYESDADHAGKLRRQVERLSDLQERLHASGSHALLAVFQGMDTAGKDGGSAM